jgi:hypothetical protein
MTSLTLNIEGEEISFNSFPQHEGLTFKTLITSDESRTALESLVLLENNANVEFYGAPGNIDLKLEIWGERGDEQQPLRTFIIEENGETAGFINLGISLMHINDKPIYEGGALFQATHNNEDFIAQSLDAIYIDYPKQLKDILTGPAFVYTISRDNPLYPSLKASGLTELNDLTTAEEQCIAIALRNNTERFSIDEETNIVTEKDREVAIFFNIFNQEDCNEYIGNSTMNIASEDS